MGPCRVVRWLGSGGMGEVYLAQHLALDKLVALKVLPPQAVSPERVERFVKEARAGAKIDHPNVVSIYDVGQQGGLHYIVMQYVEGQNMAEIVKQQGRPLHWTEAAQVIRSAARGLQAVHLAKLIHRDIKPANIMLSSEGRVLLMDFGLVRGQEDASLTHDGQIVGTPSFMSPEQCRGEPLTPASDLFSLGSTFYYLVSGRVPYAGDWPSVVSRLAQGTPPASLASLPLNLPAEVVQTIERAMAPQATRRFASAELFARQLGSLLKHQQIDDTTTLHTISLADGHVPTESLPSIELPPLAPPRPAPWVWGAVAGVIGLLVLALIVNLWLWTLPDPPANPSAPSASTAVRPPAASPATATANRFQGMIQIPTGTVNFITDRDRIITPLRNVLLQMPLTPEQQSQIDAELLNPQQRQLLNTLLDQILDTGRPTSVRTFWIDRYEVTNAQYAQFLQATNHEAPEAWNGRQSPPGQEQHPVENIRHRDAEDYARWAGKQLPTGEQWLRAFRGDAQTLYPWGDTYSALRANTMENATGGTVSVDQTPQDVSPFGVFNLVGNVAEFTRGRSTYQGQSVVFAKGGGYPFLGAAQGIGDVRSIMQSSIAVPGVGFRCVIEEGP